MKVFLSWSGQRGRELAELLRDWLPDVLQAVQPWLSSDDIPLGPRWPFEVARRLENADAGIICLTQDNIHPNWLKFEPGPLSKSLTSLIGIYALDVAPADLGGPLSPFQCAITKKESTYRLIESLNSVSGSYQVNEECLKTIFEIQWPNFENRLKSISGLSIFEKTNQKPKSIEEKLDEALDLLHSIYTTAEALPPSSGHVKKQRSESHNSKPRVFISSSIEGLHIAETIQKGLEPLSECKIWTQDLLSDSENQTEKIVNIAADFDYAVIVLTLDDILIKDDQKRLDSRDNMVFEIGLFTGCLGRARTFLVLCKDDPIHLPSDLIGVTVAMYSKRSAENIVQSLEPVCTQIKRAMGAI